MEQTERAAGGDLAREAPGWSKPNERWEANLGREAPGWSNLRYHPGATLRCRRSNPPRPYRTSRGTSAGHGEGNRRGVCPHAAAAGIGACRPRATVGPSAVVGRERAGTIRAAMTGQV